MFGGYLDIIFLKCLLKNPAHFAIFWIFLIDSYILYIYTLGCASFQICVLHVSSPTYGLIYKIVLMVSFDKQLLIFIQSNLSNK